MSSRVMKLLASGLLLFAACGGGDDGDTGTTKSPTKIKDGELACGSGTCSLPEELKGATLCCKDPFAGGCGIKAGASCRDYPKVDARCPAPSDITLPSFPGTDASPSYGCCTSANECGVDIGAGPPGASADACRPRSFLCNLVDMTQVGSIQPQTCDGDPLPLPDGCGMNAGRFGRGRGAGGAGGMTMSGAAGAGN